MIVYNVARDWFTEKADAEVARKRMGLRPAETRKVEVGHRADLAALLNALCSPPAPGKPIAPPATADIVECAYVAPNIDVPLYIPAFLLTDPEMRKRQEERLASMTVAEVEKALKEEE